MTYIGSSVNEPSGLVFRFVRIQRSLHPWNLMRVLTSLRSRILSIVSMSGHWFDDWSVFIVKCDCSNVRDVASPESASPPEPYPYEKPN